MPTEMFEERAEVYDGLIDWPKRLTNEEPFFRRLFERVGVRRVLDVACGTGHHAAMFHRWGLEVEGIDLSPAMIERCRQQFGQSASLRWTIRAFDQPPANPGAFDAAICVGNSLALAPDHATAARAVTQMLAAVRPGGVCMAQVVNLWSLPEGPCVWQKCKRVTLHGREHILVKAIHRAGALGFVEFLSLATENDAVTPSYECVRFLGLEEDELRRVAEQAGAARVQFFGNYQFTPYQRERSPDLILVAEK